MKQNDIKKNLFAAVSEMIPEDEYQRITQRLASTEQQEKVVIQMTAKKKSPKVINFKKMAGVAVAAAVAVAVGLFGFGYYNSNFAVASVIDIDVNPSVELTTNKKDIVLDAEPLNGDAFEVLNDMELKGTNVDVAVNAIIGAMVQNGYLKGQDNEILITVKNGDAAHADELQKRIVDDVDSALQSHNVGSSIINQTLVKTLTEAEKFAEEYGVSVGKANFVLKLAEKAPDLNAAELVKLTLKDIASLVAEKKIDISEIADHDPYDSIWENIAETVEDVNEQAADKPQSQPQNNGVITKKKAIEIALRDAGLKESQVHFVKEELDSEKGKKAYEVEFYHEGTEYDYEIDANTGKILSSDLDIEDYVIPQKNDDKQENKPADKVESKPESQNKSVIGVAAAKEAALKHAGVNSSDAKFIKAKQDYDDGRRVYDVEFNALGFEYDYELDADSGEILNFDKEKDDDYVPPVASKPQSSSKISSAAAKKAALKHAGVKSSNAYDLSVEYDNDDGDKIYEVEFKSNGYEYAYEIDAISGKVLSHEKERDD